MKKGGTVYKKKGKEKSKEVLQPNPSIATQGHPLRYNDNTPFQTDTPTKLTKEKNQNA